MHVAFIIVVCTGPLHHVGQRISASEEEGEAGEAGMLCSFYLEVGHVHSATFVISGSTINHVRGGVNAQWLCSAGGLSLWMPGPQPRCTYAAISPAVFP